MSHPRQDIRAAVRLALEGVPRFAAMSFPKSFARDYGTDQRPLIAVATSREQSARSDQSGMQKRTFVQVHLQRTGGADLEDDLDLDAEEIEAAVEAIRPVPGGGMHLTLTDTEIDFADGGKTRIGMLQMTFAVLRFTPRGTA